MFIVAKLIYTEVDKQQSLVVETLNEGLLLHCNQLITKDIDWFKLLFETIISSEKYLKKKKKRKKNSNKHFFTKS